MSTFPFIKVVPLEKDTPNDPKGGFEVEFAGGSVFFFDGMGSAVVFDDGDSDPSILEPPGRFLSCHNHLKVCCRSVVGYRFFMGGISLLYTERAERHAPEGK